MEAVAFIEGDKFPIDVSHMGYGAFIIGVNNVVIKTPEISDELIEVFSKGFSKYSYYETKTKIPIALWIFKFQKPFEFIEVNFNAKLVPEDTLRHEINIADEDQPNVWMTFLVHNGVLRKLIVSGLYFDAMKRYYNTIRKQMEMDYSNEEYTNIQNHIANKMTMFDTFKAGKKYKHAVN